MAEMPTRLKDIAKCLNLSISTVSAVIQNRQDISQATREKVLQKIDEMGYRPNGLARGLVTQKSRILGVVVPDLSRSFFAEVTKGIDGVASSEGYNLLLSNTEEDPTREDRALEMLISQRVEGLIIASARKPGSSQPWKKLAAMGIPLVLVDRRFPTVPFVGVDDERVGYLATEHLINQGYRRIAHISGPQTTSTAIGRLKGYKRALRESGRTPNLDYLVQAHYHEESSGLDAMRFLLGLPSPPNAVFAASDPIAIGSLQAMCQSGLRLPEDTGIIGVGNHRYSQYLRFQLSTIDQRRLEIGKSAARLLLDLIDGKQRAKVATVLLEPELIIRSSSCRFASQEYGEHPGLSRSLASAGGKRV